MVKSKPINKNQGATLVEAILAIALFSLFVTALIGLIMNSYGSNFQAKEKGNIQIYCQPK